MNTSIKNISNCTREVEFVISQDEFNQIYQSTFVKYQKNIKLSGFRPGKVPVDIVKKQYGSVIKMEADEDAANKYLKEYISSNNINVIGSPSMTDVKDNDDGSHTYIIRFDVIPDFELNDYKSMEIDEPVHRISDEEIDADVLEWAKRLGTTEKLDMVTNYDANVIIDSYRLDKETKEVITSEEPVKNIPVDLSNLVGDDLKEIYLNAKVGDELIYTPPNMKDNENLFPEKIVIKEITRIIPVPVDDELAKKVTNGRFDNLEDFKQELGFQMQKQWDDRARNLMEEQVLDNLVQAHKDMDVPEALLKIAREQLENNYKNKNELKTPAVQQYIEHYSKLIVVKELVLNKIIEQEKLQVEDFDIELFVEQFIQSIPQADGGQYSKDMFVEHIRNDEHSMQSLLNKKLMDFILDFTTTHEIDFDEFYKKHSGREQAIFEENFEQHEHEHGEDCGCHDDECSHDADCDCEK